MNVKKGLAGLRTLSIALFFELATWYVIILLISLYLLRQPSLYIAGIMWIGGVCGMVISVLVGRKRRWMTWLCILLVGGLIFATLGQFNIGIRGWMTWFVVTATALRGSRLNELVWKSSIALKHQLVGIGCTLILFVFSFKLSLTALDAGSLYVAGLISLCSWLLRLNSTQVQKETLSDIPHQQVALKGFVSVNRRWSIVVMGVMIAFGAFTQLSQGLYWLWIQFAKWLNVLLGHINQPSDSVTSQQEIIPPELFPMDGEPTKDSGTSIWMEVIYWVIGLILAVVVMYLLYQFVRFISRQLGRLIAMLTSEESVPRNHQSKDTASYIDKIEKIETKRRPRPFRRKRDNLPEDIHGKVRYYYKRMVQRAIQQGLSYSTSQTPNEVAVHLEGQKSMGTIQSISAVQEMTSFYNDVRYGEKEVEEQQLQHTIDRLKERK